VGVSCEEQPVSEFAVVSEGATGLRCTLVVRTAPPVTDGAAVVAVNGHELGAFDLDGCWRRYDVDIPRELVARGVNVLRLTWMVRHVAGPGRMRGFAELTTLRWSVRET
jgi:hypothetical protein